MEESRQCLREFFERAAGDVIDRWRCWRLLESGGDDARGCVQFESPQGLAQKDGFLRRGFNERGAQIRAGD